MEKPKAEAVPHAAGTPISVISADPLPSEEGRELINELMNQMDEKADAADTYGAN
jgi:hypothetical protein